MHKDGNKSQIAFDKLEEEDDLALTQSVLEQLKTFQMEMNSLETPVLEVEENLDTTNTNVLHNHKDFSKVPTQQQEDQRTIDEVQLKDRLNAHGIECYLSVQRTVRKDGYAVYICEFCAKEFRKPYDYIRLAHYIKYVKFNHIRINKYVLQLFKTPTRAYKRAALQLWIV